MSGVAFVMISPSSSRTILRTPWVAGWEGPILITSFSPRSSDSLIVSNDLAVRAKVAGVSIVYGVAIRFKGRPVHGLRASHQQLRITKTEPQAIICEFFHKQ